MASETQRRFLEEIGKTIDYFRSEYEMTYAECVGCLTIAAHGIAAEAFEDEDE